MKIELNRGCGSGFGLVPGYTFLFFKGPGQHIIRCLKNKKCENERLAETVRDTPRLHEVKIPIGVATNGCDEWGDAHA